MSLNARNRVGAIDVLQNDYEYCTISYYVTMSRNDLGEPIRVLTQRATNVKCSIDPMQRLGGSKISSYKMTAQGLVEETTHYMIVSADQIIEAGDVVTDYDGVNYDVLLAVNWQTHKDVFLRRIN